jgi:pimeloyl-ACP methyl ester carboxylesterase
MLPIVLVPGLMSSVRIYSEQLPELWRRGPVTVAQPTRGETIAAMAEQILSAAPPSFALAGHSMGGYVALEVMRQAPERVARLALLSTSARPDTPEQTERRGGLIALTESGRFGEVPDLLFPFLVHESRRDDERLRELTRAMADDVGAEAFVRQQRAIIVRADSRPLLATIACRTLVVHGVDDAVIPFENGEELARGIQGARLVRLDACGHVVTAERADETTRPLVEWLDA